MENEFRISVPGKGGKYAGNEAVSVFTLRGTLGMSKVKEIDNFKAKGNCFWRIVKNEPTEPQIQ